MANDIRLAELAKIHIAKKDLKLSDDDYEALVMGASGRRATSAKDLDSAGRGRLLGALKGLGWKPKSATTAGKGRADDPQSRMVRGMWIELSKSGAVRDGSETALRSWIEGEVKKADLRFCSSAEKGRLIEALKAWKARALAETSDG